MTLQVADAEHALHELEHVLHDQRTRWAMRRQLAALGATGAVDQLTLALIRGHLPEAETLRTLGHERCIWPMPGVTISWRDGRVRSSGEDMRGMCWSDLTLSFEGAVLPETALTAAIGRPVTDLVQHPLLSCDMVVAAARNRPADMHQPAALIVALRLEERLFSAPRAIVCDATDGWKIAPASPPASE